jgi:hypothetical protein
MIKHSIFIASLALVAVACTSSKTQDAVATVAAATDSGVPNDLITGDAEREKYVTANLEITGLDVGPDVKPGDDGGVINVGGLYKAAGLVKNKGDKAVKNATIVLNIMDDKGTVIGTYFHDVVGNKRLAPGEERPFKFTIPEKKEYAGKFTHKLR